MNKLVIFLLSFYLSVATAACRRRRSCTNYCSGGAYHNEKKKIKRDSLCRIGEYASRKKCQQISVDICKNCTAGYFSNNIGSTKCTICPISKYQNKIGQSNCKNITAVCYEFSGFFPGSISNECIDCRTLGKIKYENTCIKCKDRYYYDTVTNTCVKIDLYKEPLFWILIIVICVLIKCVFICIKNEKMFILAIPIFITCSVSLTLYSMTDIDNVTAAEIAFGLAVLIYLSLMVLFKMLLICNCIEA